MDNKDTSLPQKKTSYHFEFTIADKDQEFCQDLWRAIEDGVIEFGGTITGGGCVPVSEPQEASDVQPQ